MLKHHTLKWVGAKGGKKISSLIRLLFDLACHVFPRHKLLTFVKQCDTKIEGQQTFQTIFVDKKSKK